jgi:ankyrin repeat protein
MTTPATTNEGVRPKDSTPDYHPPPSSSQPPLPSSDIRKRKRSADAFGRLAAVMRAENATTPTNCASGGNTQGSFTKCPLCGTVSAKTYALGRGIAAHLHAIHTPWKPTKLSRKIARRQWEQEQRRRKRDEKQEQRLLPSVSSSSSSSQTTNPAKPSDALTEYTPTHSERGEWEDKVSDIVQQLERDFQPTLNKQQVAASSVSTLTECLPAAVTKSGTPLVSYKESLPPFLQAASQGKLDTLSHMLKEDVKKTSSSSSSNTTRSLMDVLQQTDRHGSMAEHWAAGGGHLECLKLLLETKQTEMTRIMFEEEEEEEFGFVPPKKKRRRRDGKTCLHYAARNGQLDCVRYLVEDQQMDLHEASGEATTPLHMACYGGHLPVVQYLVEQSSWLPSSSTTTPRKNNPHPALATNDWGCTSAHWVAMTLNDNADQVATLCTYLQDECGVDFGARQHQGHSPLHKAAQRGNRHVLEWMASPQCRLASAELQAAAAPDQGGHTPSEIWRHMGNEEATKSAVAKWMECQGW